MEFGHDQAQGVQRLFGGVEVDGRKYSNMHVYRDYAGRDRVFFCRGSQD